MPPKKASNKQQQKKVKKIVEDKTFGMKNKKGSANQKKVQQLQSSLANAQRKGGGGNEKLSKKQLKAQRDQELKQLGILKVVPKKSAPPPTVQQEQVQNNNAEVEKVPKTLEDVLEEMRANLTGERVLITKEAFEKWKQQKKKEKEEKRKLKASNREKDIASGKARMTGRELYESKKDIFVDDNNADETVYDLHENLKDAVEEQLKLVEDASGETWDEDRRQKERLKLIESMKRNENKVNNGISNENVEEKVEIGDESLFVEEDIPDE